LGFPIVFHPDCGGVLQWVDRSQRRFYTCDKCETRVTSRDQQRIIHEFQRPGEWRPLDPDPKHPLPPSIEELGRDATPFQRLFFRQLAAIQYSSRAHLLEEARKRGYPQEAAIAFLEAKSLGLRLVKR
jgi:hypothetical protein